MSTAIFYHAGCPVCLGVEQMIADAIDHSRYQVEVVHLGEKSGCIAEAETFGVKSVPALVLDGHVFHINFGASIDALKESI
jgi:glutaredoxin